MTSQSITKNGLAPRATKRRFLWGTYTWRWVTVAGFLLTHI